MHILEIWVVIPSFIGLGKRFGFAYEISTTKNVFTKLLKEGVVYQKVWNNIQFSKLLIRTLIKFDSKVWNCFQSKMFLAKNQICSIFPKINKLPKTFNGILDSQTQITFHSSWNKYQTFDLLKHS